MWGKQPPNAWRGSLVHLPSPRMWGKRHTSSTKSRGSSSFRPHVCGENPSFNPLISHNLSQHMTRQPQPVEVAPRHLSRPCRLPIEPILCGRSPHHERAAVANFTLDFRPYQCAQSPSALGRANEEKRPPLFYGQQSHDAPVPPRLKPASARPAPSRRICRVRARARAPRRIVRYRAQ